MTSLPRIIIIDDDSLNNFIIRQNIRQISSAIEVIEFTDPDKGFEYMSENASTQFKTIVLLDLNMPQISGWELLDKFSELDSKTKECYLVYILSSSTDTNDQDMAFKHPEIKNYLIKPVTAADIKKILSSL